MESVQNAPSWRKSSRSGSGNDCVELAALPAGVGVRDSKNPTGGHIALTRQAARALAARVRAGQFDL